MIVDLQAQCRDCPLAKRPYVPAESGAIRPQIMAIGVAPGSTEEQARRPFVGEIGSIVREILGGIAGDSVYYTNLVKRMPVNSNGNQRKPTKSEWTHCGGLHLAEEISSFQPPVIVTFGHLPTAFAFGSNQSGLSIKSLHGLPNKLCRFGYDFTVVPMYDPGYVARKGGLMSSVGNEWIDDLQEVRKLVGKD